MAVCVQGESAVMDQQCLLCAQGWTGMLSHALLLQLFLKTKPVSPSILLDSKRRLAMACLPLAVP